MNNQLRLLTYVLAQEVVDLLAVSYSGMAHPMISSGESVPRPISGVRNYVLYEISTFALPFTGITTCGGTVDLAYPIC